MGAARQAAGLCLMLAACRERVEARPAEPPADSGECGGFEQPPCPLESWMKATLQPQFAPGAQPQLDRVAEALDRLAASAPPEYSRWAGMASRGAQAARRTEMEAVKRSCAECHDAYRTPFRLEMRARRLF